MKTNDRHEDTALRRVMEKQAQQAGKMQLPEDFADRVMNRIARQADGETVSTPSPAPARLTHLRKVAAILIAGIFISGLAFATWKLSNGHSQQTAIYEKAAQADSAVTFSNVRLDSILHRVSRHYDRRVRFQNEQLREWRFQIVWEPAKPLAEFVSVLNEFDGLRVSDREKLIIVEATKK